MYHEVSMMQFVRPLCGARLKQSDGRCRRWPVRGRTRCRLHGGLSTGPRVHRSRDVSAAVVGRRRWLERMKRAKAEGRIAKIPCGRIPGRRMWEPIEISRARVCAMNEIAVMDKRRNEAPQLFDDNRLLALRLIRHILSLPNAREEFDSDLAHHRRLTLQANAAQSVLVCSIRVDDSALRAQQHEDWLEAFNKKLAEAEANLLKRRQERN
jgi:hypothetical protein